MLLPQRLGLAALLMADYSADPFAVTNPTSAALLHWRPALPNDTEGAAAPQPTVDIGSLSATPPRRSSRGGKSASPDGSGRRRRRRRQGGEGLESAMNDAAAESNSLADFPVLIYSLNFMKYVNAMCLFKIILGHSPLTRRNVGRRVTPGGLAARRLVGRRGWSSRATRGPRSRRCWRTSPGEPPV